MRQLPPALNSCSSVLRSTSFSMTMQFSPSVVGLPSAMTQASNTMRQPEAMRTSPQIVVLGTAQLPALMLGLLPSCERIIELPLLHMLPWANRFSSHFDTRLNLFCSNGSPSISRVPATHVK